MENKELKLDKLGTEDDEEDEEEDEADDKSQKEPQYTSEIAFESLGVRSRDSLKIVEATFTRLLDKIQLKRRNYIG